MTSLKIHCCTSTRSRNLKILLTDMIPTRLKKLHSEEIILKMYVLLPNREISRHSRLAMFNDANFCYLYVLAMYSLCIRFDFIFIHICTVMFYILDSSLKSLLLVKRKLRVGY